MCIVKLALKVESIELCMSRPDPTWAVFTRSTCFNINNPIQEVPAVATYLRAYSFYDDVYRRLAYDDVNLPQKANLQEILFEAN